MIDIGLIVLTVLAILLLLPVVLITLLLLLLTALTPLILAVLLVYVLILVRPQGKKPTDERLLCPYAHRGLHGDGAPENSLEAFRRACDAGYGIELDVQTTRDGVVVVFHDYNLSRMTGKDALLTDLTLAELKALRLDGTEEIYNRSKAFIYEGVNAFKVVTDNIEGLLKEDVFVSIRLNLGEHNKEDLYKLVEWIDKRYPDKSHLSVYAHLLFEYYDNAVKDDLRGTLAADLIELEDYCRRVGLRNDRTFTDGIKTTRCMADNDGAITITPTGKLGKCEHYTEDNFAGDIYNGITDPDTVARFKERSNTKEICSGCAAYPSCIILKMCPDVGNTVCNNAARKIAETALERSLVATYKKIKEQKNKAK